MILLLLALELCIGFMQTILLYKQHGIVLQLVKFKPDVLYKDFIRIHRSILSRDKQFLDTLCS